MNAAEKKVLSHPGVCRYEEDRALRTLHGMDMPAGDLEAVRAVAAWINKQRDEGWGVPFLSVHGLLLRYPESPDVPDDSRFHIWLPAGDPVFWDGLEFTQRWGMRRADDPAEVTR